MCKIEAAAAPLFEALVAGDRLADHQRYDFASFLALMFVRTNFFRRIFAETYGNVRMLQDYLIASDDSAFESQMERFQEARGKISEEAKQKLRARMLDPSDYVIQISRESTLKALESHGRLVPLFYSMEWSVLCAPDGAFFITSDNPLLQWVPPEHHHSFYGTGGFRNRHAEAILSLSPTHSLVGHWQVGMPKLFATTTERVEFTNELIAGAAERFLYSHVESKSVSDLAKQHVSSQRTVTIHGPGPEKKAEIKVVRSF